MKNRREQRTFIAVFLGPPLALYLLFVLLPAFNAFRYSLTQWDGLGKPVAVGFANFQKILASGSDFYSSLGHNLFLTFVPGTITLCLAPQGFRGHARHHAVFHSDLCGHAERHHGFVSDLGWIGDASGTAQGALPSAVCCSTYSLASASVSKHFDRTHISP